MKKVIESVSRLSLYIFFALVVSTVCLLTLGYRSRSGPAVVLLFVSLASYFTGHKVLKGFAFTVWVFAFVAASMIYPAAFGAWFGFDLKGIIIPLIQIIMFGMGTTLSVKDFAGVVRMPWPVFVGFVLQFSLMPLGGYAIASMFGFEPQVAAGIILVGSCPGGVASNVMTYLARGNVALSVTMTSCSTLMSPVMTPFLMKVLAGRLIPINFVEMMVSIFDMIIVPIVAGLIANRILYSRAGWMNKAGLLIIVSAATIALAVAAGFVPDVSLGPLSAVKGGIIIGFLLIGVVAISKWIVQIVLKGPERWMDRALPIVSMAAICLIIAVITARSREKLLTVGPVLMVAVMMHNIVGYLLGYWLARLIRLDQITARTIAIEVGMQNAGMGSSVAMTVLNSANAALAPAIFGPWQNVSGSILATWWHRKPVKTDSSK